MADEFDKESIQKRKLEIQAALNVDGYHGWLDFDDDIFLLDYWDEVQGLKYLAGIDEVEEYFDEDSFIKVNTLDQDFYLQKSKPHITSAFLDKLNRLKRIWKSGAHPQSNPPAYYIDWALSKGFDIPWLKYAIEKGYYKPKQEEAKIDEKKSNLDSGTHVSDKLATLKQATARFWANADPSDRTTHPDNRDVAAWLIERGYSQTLAESAATIIRPKWAATGRKPEK